ncbi:hypothetical protein L596_023857 [Steinernema carpocapsae]|uniref:PDZ domain-containing protein n=1 Tax=Steinernema carpocapsae TaxID=34508 RepID=A0A4U5MEY5_STECR|nr:hypothetical protein L596_023857 [Steinernema carpocapsae]
MSLSGHMAGKPMECVSFPIELQKEEIVDPQTGDRILKVGFRIGGGIDMDPKSAPYRYPDHGVYITHVDPMSPAGKAGLKVHDKILQHAFRVNGNDFTMIKHEKAVTYIKRYDVLHMLVARTEISAV